MYHVICPKCSLLRLVTGVQQSHPTTREMISPDTWCWIFRTSSIDKDDFTVWWNALNTFGPHSCVPVSGHSRRLEILTRILSQANPQPERCKNIPASSHGVCQCRVSLHRVGHHHLTCASLSLLSLSLISV